MRMRMRMRHGVLEPFAAGRKLPVHRMSEWQPCAAIISSARAHRLLAWESAVRSGPTTPRRTRCAATASLLSARFASAAAARLAVQGTHIYIYMHVCNTLV
jgi:hypothetical protein